MEVKLRLIIDVEYETYGTPIAVLKAQLHSIAEMASREGLLSSDTPAEVEKWSALVENLS